MLISEPLSPTCTGLADTLGISHDSVNRFLEREHFEPHDLYDQAMQTLASEGGVLSIDDTVIDKPYSHHMHLVDYYWSVKHHKAVQGINLITLYYTDKQGNSLPVNYRLYDHSDNKTKNDYFLDMLDEVLQWGLSPSYVTGDSWYSPTKNLKSIKYRGLGFMFAIKPNRTLSTTKGTWQQVQSVPEERFSHQPIWLKDFGFVYLSTMYKSMYQWHFKLFRPIVAHVCQLVDN